jgi:hypothetical protein
MHTVLLYCSFFLVYRDTLGSCIDTSLPHLFLSHHLDGPSDLPAARKGCGLLSLTRIFKIVNYLPICMSTK